MINEETKKRWCDALRSGTYKQGRKVLCNINNEYCCLGVLAEILGFKKCDVNLAYSAEEDDGLVACDCYNFKKSNEDNFQKWYSMLPDNILDYTDQQHLAELNDNGMSFEEIADYIELKL